MVPLVLLFFFGHHAQNPYTFYVLLLGYFFELWHAYFLIMGRILGTVISCPLIFFWLANFLLLAVTHIHD